MWFFVCEHYYDDEAQCYKYVPLQAFRSKAEAEEVCDIMQEFYNYNLCVMTKEDLNSQ